MKQAATWATWALAGLLLAGCGSRPTAAERPLLPNDTTERFWLLNEVLWDGDARQHVCLLLTRSRGADPQPSAAYVGLWDSRDSSYRQGARVCQAATWGKAGRWPLHATLPADSGSAGWRAFLDHKAFWVDAALQAPAAELRLRGRLQAPAPFACQPLLPYPPVHAFPCVPIRQSIGDAPPEPGYLQGAVFEDGGGLLAEGAIAFVQLMDESGRQSVFLFSEGGDSSLDLRLQYEHVPGKGWASARDMDARWKVERSWSSPDSHKRYGLWLRCVAPYYVLHIAPCGPAQEQRLGKRSFWMGAVALSLGGGPASAYGNMYVFTR